MKMITIRVSLDVAKRLQWGLSDLACWARGYVSALAPDDRLHYEPMGISQVRDMNIILKGALDDHDEGKDPVDDVLSELSRRAYRASDEARGTPSHAVAAYIHDEISNARRKLNGQPALTDPAPWPFGDRP